MNAYIRASKASLTGKSATQYAGFLEIDGCIEIQTSEERTASLR